MATCVEEEKGIRSLFFFGSIVKLTDRRAGKDLITLLFSLSSSVKKIDDPFALDTLTRDVRTTVGTIPLSSGSGKIFSLYHSHVNNNRPSLSEERKNLPPRIIR